MKRHLVSILSMALGLTVISPLVFADDNDANLAGAKKAGIQAFFYEGFDHFMGKLKELGVEL